MVLRFTHVFALTLVLSTTAGSQEAATSNARDAGGIVVVVGAAGTPEYGEQFAESAGLWKEVARKSETPIRMIGLDAKGDKSDRETLQSVLQSVKPQGTAPLWLVMIGHGTFARSVAKFNLRGPDVSAAELAEWLAPIERPVVVANTASASGPFVNRLSGPNRVIVTATKSGNEDNFARFGKYFSLAIAAPDSDLDHDDEVSVHEAFLRASADVRNFYETEARIASEHALIDDNGDGKGTPATMFRGTRANAKAKDGATLDGPVASRVTLTPAGSRLPFTDEELQQRAEIETQLDELRTQKQNLTTKQYDEQLEPLMIKLAKIYREAEKRAGR